MADKTDTVTQEAATTTAATESKPKTVIKNMDSRRMFADGTSALAYLNKSGEDFTDFESIPQIVNGVGIEGEGDDAHPVFDPEIYTDSMRVMVAVLASRGEKGQESTAKAIVVTPAPTLDALLADAAAKAWVEKIIDKELNHVAVRALRNAEDVESVQDQMPLTIADYISSSRESTGGIMETFSTLFKGIITSIAAKSPAWAKARLIKSELKKAFESAAYAKEYYPTLEDRGDKPSLFVMGLQLGVREATKQGLDPAIFNRWLETRNAKALKTTTDEDDDDFDLDDVAFESDDEAKPTDDTAAPAPEATDSTVTEPEAEAGTAAGTE